MRTKQNPKKTIKARKNKRGGEREKRPVGSGGQVRLARPEEGGGGHRQLKTTTKRDKKTPRSEASLAPNRKGTS